MDIVRSPALPSKLRPWRLVAVALIALAVAGPHDGRAADPVPYTVTLAPSGIDELDAAMGDLSLLQSLRESAPVGPSALVARARADSDRFTAALHSLGHYGGSVAIRIDGMPADAPEVVDRLDALPDGTPVAVEVRVTPGPVYPLRRAELLGPVSPKAREAFPLAPGQPARADTILAARETVRGVLRSEGHALAEVSPPDAVLYPEAKVVDVTYTAKPGPVVDIGAIQIAGLERLDPEFVRQRLLLRSGERFDPARIEAARRDLAGLPVLSSVRITEAQTLAPDGTLPVEVQVTERKRRLIEFGAAWSTDEGGRLSALWTHRNLFGHAEQLTLSAAVTNLGGTAVESPGYNLDARLVLPEFYARDQALTLNANAQRAYLQAYDKDAISASATLSRKLPADWLGPGWIVSAGLAGQQSRITQEGVVSHYTLAQVPMSVLLDTSNDLLEPTRGLRANLSVTPTMDFGPQNVPPFTITQAAASTYLDLSEVLGKQAPGRSVLAVRALVGVVWGGAADNLPPDQRFYAGGTATIRGYRFQSVGPQFPSGNPAGGNSIDTASIEWRQRFGESWGGAVFVDAGQVGTQGIPFTGDLRVGAGIGVRYYTAIGPIRADIAVPLIKQSGTDAFQLYIGIGQAF